METNSVNTDLSEELLNSLAKEERTELLDFINNYPFINWMVSANRPYAKDVPKDKTGKIIVDIVKPHILENTNYFRKAAIAYKKYGRYTNLRPNGNPNSPYMKWLRKEVLKCWYGCKRPSDGEWITGYHYFYLNYSPIERSTSTVGDSKAVGRVVDFPDFYDLDYLFFHYVNQARYGGKYNNYEGGQHCGIIAARGKGKSFKVSSMSARNFILGENMDVCEKVKSLVVASNTEYLRKDGTLNKTLAMADFLAKNTQFPSNRVKSSTQDMHWIMGYKDPKNKDVVVGTKNEILGLSFNNDSDRGRGKRSQLIVWEEFGMFPNFLDAWNTSRPNTEEGGFAFGQSIAIGCVCAGSKVFTKNGDIKNIEDLKIEDGIIGYSSLHKSYSKENISYIQPIKQKECVEISTSSGKIIRCSLDHPILTPNSFIEASKLEIGSDICLINKVPLFGQYEPLNALLEGRLSIKFNSLPSNIGLYSKKALKNFFKGFFGTSKRGKNNTIIVENNLPREVLEVVMLLLLKFGLHSSIKEKELIVHLDSNLKNNSGYTIEKVAFIKNIGIQTIYNLTANNTHTYLVNGIVTHNTGGSSGSDFSGALEMIYNPLGYNVYGIPNVYDKGASGGAKCIFFIGEYMNRKGCYDKDGNSDIVKAVLEEVKERVFIKYNSSDPSTIAQRIAEHPMSIQEAIMRRDGTLFPVADLTDHLNYIEANKIEWNRGHLVGELSQDPNGNISFKPTDDEPIRDFPLKDNRHRGALEIYELPKEVNGKVPSYRYIAGVDPIDDDHSTTVSLPSIIVLDMFTDRVVAEYTGRPDFADDFYEICRRLGIYYNALINYENDKKGLFTYFSNNHCTYLLAQTPEILRDTELVKSSLYGNKSFGTQSGKQVNAYARRLIRDWLLMPVKQTKIEIDENGNEVEKTVTVKNLQRLRGVAMIKELIMWNPDINADRVSALGMLMILRENNMKYLPGEGTSTGKKARKNYLGNDPFFTNNFANTTFW